MGCMDQDDVERTEGTDGGDGTEGKSTIDERLTGVRDPKDPDGLLTVEEDAEQPDPARYGTDETDTLEAEQARYARLLKRDE
jgi:hypothetical protein